MMRLAAASKSFPLGQAAVGINEGLPAYLVGHLEQRYDLRSLTVGILGLTYKGDTDDIRCSLAYRLRQLLADRPARRSAPTRWPVPTPRCCRSTRYSPGLTSWSSARRTRSTAT